MRWLSLIVPPLCVACRAPAGPHALCPGCRRALEPLPGDPVALHGLRVWAPLAYRGPARAMVAGLKFRDGIALADGMAAAIAAMAPPGLLSAPLAPVPGRGHAEALASALACRSGLELVQPLERRGGARQVGRARSQRLRSPPRFAAGPGAGPVVLVDDVVTTGATLAACAAALEAAGWTSGTAVAYARTPG